jgi:SNF2 family DNA or RNA helicase
MSTNKSNECLTCKTRTWSGRPEDEPLCVDCSQQTEATPSTLQPSIVTTDTGTESYSHNFPREFASIEKWLSGAGLEQKPHQFQGFEWIFKREAQSKKVFGGLPGGLVADEMGLGKTMLMIGLMLARFVRHTLIVVPPALLSQWASEIKKTTNHNILIFHGHYKNTITYESFVAAPIVITTYGHLVKETSNPLLIFEWGRVIFDEAHHLRNKGCAFKGAMKLKRESVWMLTGTPIQNKLSDLDAYWKMLNVDVNFSTLYNLQDDDTTYQELKDAYILRRTKVGVNLNLPPVHSKTVMVKWETDEERDLADEIHAALPFSNSDAKPSAIVAEMTRYTLAALVRCRQVCTKTALLLNVMTKLQQDIVCDESEDDSYVEQVEMPCVLNMSKINAVVRTIVERKDNDRKKLVFSHYRGEIDELKLQIGKHGLNVEYFDGRVSQTQRAAILNANNADVLILQIKTACEGLNLQKFKEVYFVTPHWNPAVEDQAVARCHRIGQTDDVNVFRFVMENFGLLTQTIDSYCTKVQEKKRELQAIIE